MECNFCNKILSTKSALVVHQQKTKYCLKIQGKTDISGDFRCNFCDKKFTNKSTRNNHHIICSENSKSILDLKKSLELSHNKNKILEKELEISKKELENTKKEKDKFIKLYNNLAQISAKKSTVTNNKTYTKNITTNNLSVFDKSPAEIENCVQNNYTEYHLRNGQKGVAWFTHDHITSHLPEEKPKYLISDKSRGHGVYKENETDLVQDTYMGNLTSKIYPSIKRKATIIAQDSNGDIFSDKQLLDGWHDTQKMEEDNTGFCKEYVKKSALITK